MTKQHIFIIENNLQKVGQSFFHLSRQTTVIQDPNFRLISTIHFLCLGRKQKKNRGKDMHKRNE
jgi:hypothetical protein